MAFLDSIFNPWLLPLFNSNPFLGILITSFAISLLITIIYKLVTNQEEMKRLKEQQKEFQKRMKELRSKPDEMMKVQKEAMQVNMKYMKQSFKPTLITMLPILLIFGWLAAHLSFEPIYPGETYSVSAEFAEGVMGNATLVAETSEILSDATQIIEDDGVTWRLKTAELGSHYLSVTTDHDERTRKVLISKDLEYEEQVAKFEDSADVTSIRINYNKLRPLGDFSILGWEPGWLGLYIILSVVFSMGLRKIMGVY